MIVAIDGPAGSGKSTTARGVAHCLGYFLLHSGAFYRAVGLAFLRRGLASTAENAEHVLNADAIVMECGKRDARIFLNGEDVSSEVGLPEVAQMASEVATLPIVRKRMVAQQRKLGRQHRYNPGLVVDGRDIGTKVFPDAELKIFLTAPAEVRARRRHSELDAAGRQASFAAVLREIEARDRRDRERTISPLVRADDAVELDTAGKSIEEQVDFVVSLVKERTLSRDV